MAQENLSSSPTRLENNKMAPRSSSGKDAHLEALRARQIALESTISQLLSQRTSLVNAQSSSSQSDHTQEELSGEERAKVAVDNANERIKAQIKQLQRYNDIKDIGTQLMGMIAEKRGCRIGEVQEEFGMDAED